jgi:hypothetical protein
MTDSTTKGFLESVASDILSEDFDDRFQEWLAEALGIAPQDVRPVVQSGKRKLSDCRDTAFFMFDGYERTGRNEPRKKAEGASEVFGTVSCTVVIYSPKAREKALLLLDAGDFSQNTLALEKMGLGFISAELRAILTEEVGDELKLRADVVLNFNYRYSRDWAVHRLAHADADLIYNQ